MVAIGSVSFSRTSALPVALALASAWPSSPRRGELLTMPERLRQRPRTSPVTATTVAAEVRDLGLRLDLQRGRAGEAPHRVA